MAWTKTEWACGHSGSMQLYGKVSSRAATVANAAGQKCMACWLVERWEKEKDPCAQRPDRYKIAADIAENKGKRINVDDDMPVVAIAENPLSNFSTEDLQAEIDRRKKIK